MNRYTLPSLATVLLFVGAPAAHAQKNPDMRQSSSTQLVQATVPQSTLRQGQHQPYYVDPSRFYYNRPPTGSNIQRRYLRPNYYYHNRGYYYNRGPRNFYHPHYNYYGWPGASVYGYYGGPVYYGHIPDVTVHVGPFIPY